MLKIEKLLYIKLFVLTIKKEQGSRMPKRGQASGAGAAILVAIIAALIVMYILFLPPAEREALLEGNATEDGESSAVSGNATILKESPGRLDYLSQKEIEHTLPSVNLYTTTKDVVFESRHSVYVKNAWFDKSFYNISFPIENLENTDNVNLVFNVKEASGKLTLKLNGRELYSSEIKTSNIEPIPLPKRHLEDENFIEVMVSGVGWKFWRTNEYTLENIKITGSVTDKSSQESKVAFQVSNTEKNNLDRVFLKFFPDCDVGGVGPLQIYLNNNEIFSSVPDCGVLRSLEISPHYLLSDENTLIFKTSRGKYLIDNLIVKSELKELTYPTYYFEMNESIHEDVLENKLDAVLYLMFPDDIEDKKAEIIVNTHKAGLNTQESGYSLNIDSYMREGNNVVEIRPKTTLDVVELKVVLEEQ